MKSMFKRKKKGGATSDDVEPAGQTGPSGDEPTPGEAPSLGGPATPGPAEAATPEPSARAMESTPREEKPLLGADSGPDAPMSPIDAASPAADEPSGAGLDLTGGGVGLPEALVAIQDVDLTHEEISLLEQKLADLGHKDDTWAFELARVVKRWRAPAEERTTSRSRKPFVFVLFMLAVLSMCCAANAIVSGIKPTEGGALHVQSTTTPVGTARLVEGHNLQEYLTLPVEKLRMVEDVAWTHRGVAHYFRIASFRKFGEQSLVLMGADGTEIKVTPGGISFQLPFHTIETLNADELKAGALRGSFRVETLNH